jgi:pimeloyl-ACP methyl ester carboxylesterase
MPKAISKDGTPIAFDRMGQGPVVILVASALADRSEVKKLAGLLAQNFTVINYDRRGRGESGDTQPYAVEREIEDIQALVDAAGEPAFIFGSSSGAVLALEAARRLNGGLQKQALYEPPFILDGSRPTVSREVVRQIDELLSANKRSQAVRLFMSKVIGVPAIFAGLMRFMPGWSKTCAMAHTLPYDLKIMEDTQAGQSFPPGRWDGASLPTLVLTGGKSEAFFHRGAQALAEALPDAQHRVLEGQHHGSVVMSPDVIASVLTEFFTAR